MFHLLLEDLVCKQIIFTFVFLAVFSRKHCYECLITRNQRAKAGIWLYRLWHCHQGVYAPQVHTFHVFFPMVSFCWLQRTIWPQRKLLTGWNKRKEGTVPTMGNTSPTPREGHMMFWFYHLLGFEQYDLVVKIHNVSKLVPNSVQAENP